MATVPPTCCFGGCCWAAKSGGTSGVEGWWGRGADDGTGATVVMGETSWSVGVPETG